ncbi:ATP-binding protein [Pseudochryseolinea flava]|uniref:histidine kinase n=1 Tax=Pseudochryseolinea flava TaxID=2059302 RepID=A0A364XVB2_9BACT|nr:ATP-binding protein [Pseudochryseolinea flava]RAV98233.1 hypothetical protein DQQ10_24845 [Pseudochryseolinea flava]
MLRNTPIKQKLMIVILLVSGAVSLLTSAAYFTYEVITFRQTTIRQLTLLGQIIAANSTAALAFDSREDATETLLALRADPNIVAAALYDVQGNLFASYPTNLPDSTFHPEEKRKGYYFENKFLFGFEHVVQGKKTLGTLYMKADMRVLNERIILYVSIGLLVIMTSLLLAFLLTRKIQTQISQPILELATKAKVVSEFQDYSVRANKLGADEIGTLTDAFNAMLAQIQSQNSALSESSARMIAVMNSALTAVVVINSTGHITEWNSHAEQIFGWSRSEALDQELANLVVPHRYRDDHRKGLHHFIATGEGPVLNKLIEMNALRRDGTEFPVELSISPLRTAHAIAFCGFITDITKRKQAEEEIRSLNQELEQKVAARTQELQIANKELEAFSYSVSHDLRAPLRSINGYMTIFADDYTSKLDDEAKRLMTIILNNAKKMGQLIDDLLEFSKLGRKELTKSRIHMREMALSIYDDLKKPEAPRQVEFTVHNIPDVKGDNATIRQVWINLISNALKYSRHTNKAVIEIDAEEQDDLITYFIKDNGAGFDMDYYDKLFGVFQRLHTAKEFEGTGVGLAIVQRIISRHGGKVWATATPNKGATFYFSLPKQ